MDTGLCGNGSSGNHCVVPAPLGLSLGSSEAGGWSHPKSPSHVRGPEVGLLAGTPTHGLSTGPGLPHNMAAGLKGKSPKRVRELSGSHTTFANLNFEVTQCHFCHSLSVKAVTKSHPNSQGGKSDFPAGWGRGKVLEEQQHCCGHFGKIWSATVTYTDILSMLIPFQCGDL